MNKFIVDAYNFAGWLGCLDQVKQGEISLKEARQKVFNIILKNPLLLSMGNKIIVNLVFDSQMDTAKKIRRREVRGLKIIFSSTRETADDFIIRIAQKGDVVVTHDRELKQKLELRGIQVKWPEFFFGDKPHMN